MVKILSIHMSGVEKILIQIKDTIRVIQKNGEIG
jgi:hypothetical protein